MEAGDLPLVGPDERAAVDDELAADVEPLDAVRSGEDEPVDRIGRAGELEPVRPPDRQVGALARRELTDVGAAEHRRAPARREPERIPRAERGWSADPACDEQRLFHLEEEVASFV